MHNWSDDDEDDDDEQIAEEVMSKKRPNYMMKSSDFSQLASYFEEEEEEDEDIRSNARRRGIRANVDRYAVNRAAYTVKETVSIYGIAAMMTVLYGHVKEGISAASIYATRIQNGPVYDF